MHNTSFTILLVCIVITGFVLRCWNINQSFWWDELWGTMPYAYADSLWKVVSNLGWFFNNHVFYSLLSDISIKIFGQSEAAARLPALLMGIIAVYALFKFGEQFIGPKQGLVASLLLAISSFHIDHSSEARSYSGLALFSLLSSLFFLKGLKTNIKNAWILFIIFTALGFYNHPFMWAVSLAQVICVVILHIGEKLKLTRLVLQSEVFKSFIVSLLVSAVITLILYSPAAPSFFSNVRKVIIVDRDRLQFIVALLESNFPGIVSVSGGIFYSIFLFAGMAFIFRKDIQIFLYFSVLLFLPLMLDLLVNPMFVFERFFIFALPFSLLIVRSSIMDLPEILKVKKNIKTDSFFFH